MGCNPISKTPRFYFDKQCSKTGRAGSPLPAERVIDKRRRAWSDAPYQNSGRRFRISREIIAAFFLMVGFDGFSRMKQNDKVAFRFLLALAGGRVFTLVNNQSAGLL
jgi:hypothetical protein